MKPSKLEAYYRDQFGADTPPQDDAPAQPWPARPARSDPPRRARRGGLGLFGLLKLALMFGPMAFLLGTALLSDCRGGAQASWFRSDWMQASWIPEMLRGSACARRDLAGRALSLDDQLRTIANGIR
ncbi:hypothetical protein [Methylobacterium goesingense]|uniref:Uncharacterized protein n=1 Tax=Methylobacterium goesingense TaxID=243690 RepID=A0ABV2L8F1_9HYPH|nr:hypothetical protein [Methylobacterium goesingense]GJD73405.1 hypothetical protein CFIICLFH_1632 [Methylobacterium goesingense]